MTTKFDVTSDKEAKQIVVAARSVSTQKEGPPLEGKLTHYVVDPEDGYKLVRKLLDALQELGA